MRKLRPIFIGGCPRSGTTLLGAMLGAHTDCLCVPESQFKTEVLQRSGTTAFDRNRLWARLRHHRRLRLWDIELPTEMPPPSSGSASPLRDILEWIVQTYGKRVGKPDAEVWVDHTPSNIRHGVTLQRAFPEARFIHIVRDGRAVAASVSPLDWGPNTIQTAARWWADHVDAALAMEAGELAESIIRIRYEDLVIHPEEVLAQLCDHVGIEFQPAMRSSAGFTVPQDSTQQHALIGGPLEVARVSAWKQELTSRQVELFEAAGSAVLDRLGYSLCYGTSAKKSTRLECLFAGAREFIRERVNRRRFDRRLAISTKQ